jgi:arabinogalactan oligomer/maltooligosaccharide transport system permease protein
LAIYQERLFDDIGNSYERMNQYIKDIIALEHRIDTSSDDEKVRLENELKELIKNKENHPYNKKLNDFLVKEKDYLKGLKESKKTLKETLKSENKIFFDLEMKLHHYENNLKFYSPYKALCYDAKLLFEEAQIKVDHLKDLIKSTRDLQENLDQAISESENIDQAKDEAIKKELEVFKSEQKAIYETAYAQLKEKRKNGLISDKALKNGKVELKKAMTEAIEVKSFDIPSKSSKEKVASLKYQLKSSVKRELDVIESNVSDVRRKTPTEVDKTSAKVAYLTLLLPGLGQILNGQKIKGMYFFLLSLFVYVAAIPYALGFGNYQGQGVAGLISLAEGGRKLDRSIIFMIEGIVAIVLIIFTVVILFLSFKDVLKVERDLIKGLRPKNWFETKKSLTEEGFPYMVSLPALVAITFVVLVPISTAILLSFTGMDPQHQNKFSWVGLENYKMIALGEGAAGGPFWNILGWTVIWTLAATTLAIAIGFGLAILSNNERVKFKTFFRAVYLLPWAVPAFITIMFFSIMFSPKGALTEILNNMIGGDTWIVVKNSPFWSRVTLIALQGWLGSAYVFLLSTGVLQAIPADLYEAAQIDGATAWQKLKRITLPIVLFQTAPLLVGQYTFNFNNFSIIYLFNSGGPFNPQKYGNLAGSTDLLISYIFKLTTENDYQAIGAAITIVISLGLMVFAFIGFKNSKAFKEEKL